MSRSINFGGAEGARGATAPKHFFFLNWHFGPIRQNNMSQRFRFATLLSLAVKKRFKQFTLRKVLSFGQYIIRDQCNNSDRYFPYVWHIYSLSRDVPDEFYTYTTDSHPFQKYNSVCRVYMPDKGDISFTIVTLDTYILATR